MTRHEPDLVGSKKSNGVQIGGETAFERDVDLDSRSEWLVEYLGGPVDAESDTETLVFGGNYDKVWKLQPSERLWPLF